MQNVTGNHVHISSFPLKLKTKSKPTQAVPEKMLLIQLTKGSLLNLFNTVVFIINVDVFFYLIFYSTHALFSGMPRDIIDGSRQEVVKGFYSHLLIILTSKHVVSTDFPEAVPTLKTRRSEELYKYSDILSNLYKGHSECKVFKNLQSHKSLIQLDILTRIRP